MTAIPDPKELDNEELIRLVTEQGSPYNARFLERVRVELFDRGYNEYHGKWSDHPLVLEVAKLEERIDALERASREPTFFERPALYRAFYLWGHVFAASLIVYALVRAIARAVL